MAVGAPTQLPTAWDEEENIPSTSNRKTIPQAQVPDDWDDDDEEEEQVTEETNQRLWEQANTKAPNPMPELILAPSATSSTHVVPPPAGAFQPTLRILRRPNSGVNSKTTTPPPSTSESFREREARYQAARERIFGSESGASTPSTEEPNSLSPSPRGTQSKDKREQTRTPPFVAVVRTPRGPTSEDPGAEENVPRGF
ncbi:hypothetical protein H0H93_000693, partial [Arthromyces matolae]